MRVYIAVIFKRDGRPYGASPPLYINKNPSLGGGDGTVQPGVQVGVRCYPVYRTKLYR